MLDNLITGGQSGAVLAGWYAARAHGIPTGGAMPLGYSTEEGPRADDAERFGAVQLPTGSYRARTEQNVRDSDGTIWFGYPDTPGGNATLGACRKAGKTARIVGAGSPTLPSHVARRIREHDIRTVNTVGKRESNAPGISKKLERYLGAVFRRLGHRRVG